MDRYTMLAIAAAAILGSPAQADDDVLSLSLGRDRAYTGGNYVGDQTVTGIALGLGSSDGLGLDIGYVDFGDIERTVPGTFGAHAWSVGLSYTIDISRRFDAIFGVGSYWSGSVVRDDHHGYWEVGARYWISRDLAVSTRFRQYERLIGEQHKVSMLSLDWAF